MAGLGNELPSIKVDGSGPGIKEEPGMGGIAAGIPAEDDIYEDAGDLDFTDSDKQVYLTRLPKFLWDSWSKLDDDQSIQIGTLRIETSEGAPKRMSMMISPDVAKRNGLPKEYNLGVTNLKTVNTFVFGEKDLPGYKLRQKDWTRNDAPKNQFNKIRKNKPKFAEYRQTVPKQTSLYGQVCQELSCLPVENAEYERLRQEQTRMALRPKMETQFVDEVIAGGGGNILNPGMLGVGADMRGFIGRTEPNKGKKTTLKAARMPQNELLDLIYDCFKEYTYWPLRSLKERLQQPEAYLKQTLEMVAVMIRNGPHAMQWQLKPESREGRYDFDAAKDEVAPNTGVDFEEIADADDDENVEMEDVLMG